MLKLPVVIANAIRVEGSIVACSLLARFLGTHLKAEVVDSARVALRHRAYPTLILVNSPWGFCDEAHRARVRELLWSARRVIWCQQDYNSGIGPRSLKSMGAWLDGAMSYEGSNSPAPVWQDGRRRLDLWTILQDYLDAGQISASIFLSPRSAFVNWNALHYAPQLPINRAYWQQTYRKKGELFYFGAFRPDRAGAFARYLKPTRYPVTISTAVGRSVERFRTLLGPKVVIEAREQNLVARLSSEWATVYIEDERNLTLRHPPAARFYEALAAGCCQFVDAAAVTTLERAGFEVDVRWIVSDSRDVELKLNLAEILAREQRRAWATARIRRQFNSQLKEALRK